MIKTSVIILNYNGIGLLKQFLPGVVTNSVQASVVVADNGSNDGSADCVRENYPEVTILAFTENYGLDRKSVV